MIMIVIFIANNILIDVDVDVDVVIILIVDVHVASMDGPVRLVAKGCSTRDGHGCRD